MKNHPSFRISLLAPLLLVPFSSGCILLHAPTPQPDPTPVPTPKPPFFNPADGQPRGNALNKAGDLVLPDAFRIPGLAGISSGDTVALQSVDKVSVGNPPKDVVSVGPADFVKLAGIVSSNDPLALAGARRAIDEWTAGQDLDVDQDPKFPVNLENQRLMSIFFKGGKPRNGKKAPYEGKTLSLNRMLVRSGWAVVDLYSPTSFDKTQWLYDEAYARKHKLGMWGLGIVVQQRVPITTKLGVGSRSVVRIEKLSPVVAGANAGANAGASTTTQITKQTTSTTTTRAVAPGAPQNVPPVNGDR